MTKPIISGIQQIGIGIPDVHAAFKWYRQHFGMDVPVFEEAAEANLMLRYTGGMPHKRHAILAVNMKGGGGFEIWQYTSRTPVPVPFEIQLGDIGHFVTRMKSDDVKASYQFMKYRLMADAADGKPLGKLLGGLNTSPDGQHNFFVQDPWGNIFEIVPGTDWFGKGRQHTGGPAGALLGVTDIEKSKKFYSEILGYDTVVYDKSGKFDDLKNLPGGDVECRRVLLKHSKPRAGAFSRLLGSSQIELVQVAGKTRKIFEGRWWGDRGYIHLCFDIVGMKEMQQLCESKGHPFTVDSANSFDMGEAAGHFSYIEDPDGTLIEFVETHKVPVLKKFGWYLNLKNRPAEKPLADWMVKSMGLNRVKD
ncbi:MAG TPA: VOC family protein [Bacteroidia bacterium]|jgi:catechol 2,3-dioxygenase-like lactoylglutathione lyase family enzyme|nr:VOC family protein [Bacteroidia bacterium]